MRNLVLAIVVALSVASTAFAIGPDEMRQAVNAVRDTIAEMGIREVSPRRAAGARAAA